MTIWQGSAPGLALVLDAHPAVALVRPVEVAGGDGVGEDEEVGPLPALLPQPLTEQAELVVEHGLQPVRET